MMWDGGVSRDMYPVPETGHYPKDIPINGTEIGRASCRERV